MPASAHWEYERALWRAGFQLVAGVDEVGRGAMAGPLIAAAVILKPCDRRPMRLTGIRDSKLLSPIQRERLSQSIQSECDYWAVGEVTAVELDEVGLAAAVRLAMERAITRLSAEADFLLLDAATTETCTPQWGLIHGDRLSVSIAAASIVAKVWRDNLMRRLDTESPHYGFAQHKGYCTDAHLAAVGTYGPGPEHRRTFSPVSAVLDVAAR